ncbi:hypothetical protein H696_04571 [Fonticula alba]|uniref:Uncharacterized protein n=1 Tax=Fonticula alba TaxID=691883 RepID=A0A058Z6J9_FONAL|nr:hypothetical protein H696_04571 [Fonticula alba]KCV69157.1 hypothetical protein H696_04571 [Fonticula alba]|eukprot:XP_009496728.1 hypothetical protein H696_04571 [Fonticula alba]
MQHPQWPAQVLPRQVPLQVVQVNGPAGQADGQQPVRAQIQAGDTGRVGDLHETAQLRQRPHRDQAPGGASHQELSPSRDHQPGDGPAAGRQQRTRRTGRPPGIQAAASGIQAEDRPIPVAGEEQAVGRRQMPRRAGKPIAHELHPGGGVPHAKGPVQAGRGGQPLGAGHLLGRQVPKIPGGLGPGVGGQLPAQGPCRGPEGQLRRPEGHEGRHIGLVAAQCQALGLGAGDRRAGRRHDVLPVAAIGQARAAGQRSRGQPWRRHHRRPAELQQTEHIEPPEPDHGQQNRHADNQHGNQRKDRQQRGQLTQRRGQVRQQGRHPGRRADGRRPGHGAPLAPDQGRPGLQKPHHQQAQRPRPGPGRGRRVGAGTRPGARAAGGRSRHGRTLGRPVAAQGPRQQVRQTPGPGGAVAPGRGRPAPIRRGTGCGDPTAVMSGAARPAASPASCVTDEGIRQADARPEGRTVGRAGIGPRGKGHQRYGMDFHQEVHPGRVGHRPDAITHRLR